MRPAQLIAPLLTLSLAACATGSTDGPDQPVDRTTYPDAEFSTEEGGVIENHSFTMTEGTTRDFQTYRADEANKLMLLSTAAGWCGACREEQSVLQELADTHGPDGLVVLVTIFEDNNNQTADTDFVQGWVDQYDLTFDVVLDAPFVMDAYYDSTLTPMNMFIDLDTMEIVRITVGFDRSVVDAIISSQLG
jgi:thiol-disulfide isomerase/thioredoxin